MIVGIFDIRECNTTKVLATEKSVKATFGWPWITASVSSVS